MKFFIDTANVEEIKNALLESKKVAMKFDAEANLYTMGAPKYRVEVTAEDYRKAEHALERIVEHTQEIWTHHDGKFSFKRE